MFFWVMVVFLLFFHNELKKYCLMNGDREIVHLLSYCPVLPGILVNTTGDTYNDSHCNAQNLVVQSQNLIQ